MTDLGALQHTLAELLRREEPLAKDDDAARVARVIATGNDRLSPVEQVDIYREQYFLRHVDVLRDDFQSLEHLLGDEPFEDLARAYLAAHPPSSFTLRDLGHAMEPFVEKSPPWSSDPLIAELARVEWAFVDAFDAPSAPPFDPSSIASAPEDAWPGARIVLSPELQRLTLAYPSHDYRIAARKHAKDGSPAPERPSAKACNVVVYRGAELLHCLEVDDDAFAFLAELARGVPLGDASVAAASASGTAIDEFQAKLGGWFQEWTALRWIARVDF